MSATPKKVSARIFSDKFRRAALTLIFILPAALEVMAQRPLGIDVSAYQGSANSPATNIVWTDVRNSGVSFAWAKATEGVTFNDADFIVNENNARNAGILIGAYHFAHPENNTPQAEANHFWNVAGNYIRGDGLSLQPVLDYETFTAPNNLPVGAASYADWANQWCSAVATKAAAAGITVKPIIYTSTCEAGHLDGTVAQWIPWIANPSGLSAQTGSPWNSTPCTSAGYELWGAGVWSVWQYNWTGSVPGIVGGVDLDVFNGSSNQMVATLVVATNTQPGVILLPQLNRVVDTGGNATFNGVGSGSPPLSYQWLFNATNLPGETNASILINDARTNNAGNYALVVTNFSGSATSGVVSLTVFPVQTTVFADDFDTDTATHWIVNQSSSDTAVTFNFDYSMLGIPTAPHSTGATTRGLLMKANLKSGICAALSLSPMNRNFTGDYRLHFDAWLNVNGPFPGGGAGSTEFLTAGIGTSGNQTEWPTNAGANGVYFSVDGEGGVSGSSTTFGDYAGYIGKNWQNAGSGIYSAGSLDNKGVYYSEVFTNGPAAPPLQQAGYPQQTGHLNAGTFGLAWHDVIISRRAGTVDWSVDGVLFATITNVTLTAGNVFVGFWDPFASLSDNNNLSFGLVDNVRVEVPAVAPVLTLQTGATSSLIGNGLTGATYILETSTNLADWTTLTSLTATNGIFEFDFVPPDGDTQRFFRARAGP